VEFETKEEAKRAIETLNDSKLDDRLIFVREDREDKKTISGRSRKDSNSGRQIFIGNLPYNTTWQELKDYCRNIGNVIRADILTNSDGRSKGQGIVLFERAADARQAIKELDGKDFQGRILQVHEDKYAY
jgi:RNA recognition motif-containing protein